MDSKRVYKKISTIFWFMLATLPFWVTTLAYIFSFFIHLDGVTSASDIKDFYNARNWSYYMETNISVLAPWTPQFIKIMFRDLFTNFSTTNVSGWFVNCLSWFVWVYMIEIMIDVFVWLPRWMHELLEKGVGKID